MSSQTAVATREARLERLDAYAQIRDLALRYAAAMVTHDRETLGLLYVDDVRVGGGLTGRDALREAYFGAALDRLSISVLHAGTHVIDLDPERPDRARGSVYTIAQIKHGERWIRQPSAISTVTPSAPGRGFSSAATISCSTAPTTTSAPTTSRRRTGRVGYRHRHLAVRVAYLASSGRPSRRVRNSSTAPSAALIAAA